MIATSMFLDVVAAFHKTVYAQYTGDFLGEASSTTRTLPRTELFRRGRPKSIREGYITENLWLKVWLDDPSNESE
jgi:hypothetical protein